MKPYYYFKKSHCFISFRKLELRNARHEKISQPEYSTQFFIYIWNQLPFCATLKCKLCSTETQQAWKLGKQYVFTVCQLPVQVYIYLTVVLLKSLCFSFQSKLNCFDIFHLISQFIVLFVQYNSYWLSTFLTYLIMINESVTNY